MIPYVKLAVAATPELILSRCLIATHRPPHLLCKICKAHLIISSGMPKFFFPPLENGVLASFFDEKFYF